MSSLTHVIHSTELEWKKPQRHVIRMIRETMNVTADNEMKTEIELREWMNEKPSKFYENFDEAVAPGRHHPSDPEIDCED